MPLPNERENPNVPAMNDPRDAPGFGLVEDGEMTSPPKSCPVASWIELLEFEPLIWRRVVVSTHHDGPISNCVRLYAWQARTRACRRMSVIHMDISTSSNASFRAKVQGADHRSTGAHSILVRGPGRLITTGPAPSSPAATAIAFNGVAG